VGDLKFKIVWKPGNLPNEKNLTLKSSLEQTLIHVWRQALVEHAKTVEVDGEQYSVKLTSKRGLREVDFAFDGNKLRGLEQNPNTKSNWAKMARAGKKVMQFLSDGQYVANVADEKVTLYHRGTHSDKSSSRMKSKK
jgi:hypothetical protein